MTQGVTLLLTVGGWGESDVEQMMRRAHQAAARDLLETLLRTDRIERAVVATDDAGWAEGLLSLPVHIDVDPPDEPFHFGRRLAGLIERYDVRRALYAGGASAPLLGAESWIDALSQLAEADRLVVTNNTHSCDWVGFAPADEVLAAITRQTSDNPIAWVLDTECGLPVRSTLPSAATRFDLDTPTDLLIARRHPDIGPHLRRYLDSLDSLGLKAPQIDAVLAEMTREGGRLALIGRVSPGAWASLDHATRCWVRVFAEERGMRASGRVERGEVRSLLADYVKLAGLEGFFDSLADLTNAVLFDDRVLLVSRGRWPSAPDRFNSDLGRWERVEDPFLRRFARAASESQIPVVLGGHSVVAGGLMALVEVLQSEQKEV